ncbi:MAG: hypothetical protein AAB618_02670 [Patescibacteria group bacterium]
MFANPTSVGISQRVVATLAACAVVLASIGYYTSAEAANLVDVSDTLSDSDLSATAAHSIAFTVPVGSAIVGGDTITIDFESGFTTVNNVVSGDITVTVNGVVDAHGGFAQSGQNFSFDSIAATAGQEVVVAVAAGNITNPNTQDSFFVTVDTGTDTGKTMVAIVNNVLVTAIVDTTFDFTITGIATSTVVNTVTTTGSTSPTIINFGQLVADTPEVLGQRLNVTTNANSGFVVTVAQDADLQSANGAIIDSFTDGTYVNTPTAWAVPTDNIALENTWGHWGLTSDDDHNASEFGAALFVAASTTPRAVFSHNGPANGTLVNVGSTSVAYKIEITPLQEAADDYQTTLTYVATPTF